MRWPLRLAGCSDVIARVCDLVERVAPFDTGVLLSGESGTGRTRVARNIHYFSRRSKGPFVPVSCGAMPAEVLEAELFGYVRGTFAGALVDRWGRFELAAGGTLFLDEVAELPLGLQARLLGVLRDRSLRRLGSDVPLEVDCRVVSSSCRNLDRLVEARLFDEELYYRLCVFPIELPPLRSRIEDLPFLVEDLAVDLVRDRGVGIGFDAEALAALAGYAWPGNVRELANLMERLAILCPDRVVGPGRLPDWVTDREAVGRDAGADRSAEEERLLQEMVSLPGFGSRPGLQYLETAWRLVPPLPADGLNLPDRLHRVEAFYIRSALARTRGVVAHAAPLLGLRRTTLMAKMARLGLDPSQGLTLAAGLPVDGHGGRSALPSALQDPLEDPFDDA